MGSLRPRHSTHPKRLRSVKSIAPQGGRAHKKLPGVPASALCDLRTSLRLIQSSVIVVRHALMEQKCLVDDDAARVLRVHVGDALQQQIECIDSVLGEETA